MTEPLLTTTDASFAFGDVQILDDVSVELERGMLTAFVGPNGSGKTTVLELLTGLRNVNSGTVSRPANTERTIAYLPQMPAFRSGFTVKEIVEVYGGLVEQEYDAEAVLSRVGLGNAVDRPVEALSGGMTRLLGLAQALIGDPPVVVLDEPTSGLDPDVADHIFDVISDIADEGRLVVIASHDLAAVESYADRVLLLSNGEFRLDAPPETIIETSGANTLREAFSGAVHDTDRTVDTDLGRGGDA
jgi:ABC-type multidrug transport system ATPase subunit